MIVTLQPFADMNPVPRVQISLEEGLLFDGGDAAEAGVSDLDGGDAVGSGSLVDGGVASTVSVDVPEGTDRVTLWRTCGGRRLKVRGGIGRVFSGALGLLDLEAGRGVSSSYELECWAGDARVGVVSLGSALLPGSESGYHTVVQQPLNPRLSVVLEELDVMVPEVSRVAPGDSVRVEGSSFPSLVGFGPRSGVQGVELAFACLDRVTAGRVWATLGDEVSPQLPVWLVRSTHPLLPPVFFCDARSLREVSLDLDIGGVQSRFFMSTSEVAPPVPGLVVASLSYPDLAAVFPTYSEMALELPTYSRMASAWDYAGAAG